MGNVNLLRAGGVVVAESLKQIRGSCLESCKRLRVERVVEVVVDAQILLLVDPVVQFHGELVGVRTLIGNGLEDIGATWREIGALGVRVRTGDVAFHEVNCDGVQAVRRNYASGKKCTVGVAYRGAEITPGIEDVSNQLILNGGAGIEWRSREVSVSLSSCRNHDGIGGDSVDHAASFIRREEEGPIFLDRTAKRSAELVLLVIGPPQIEVAFGIE